MSHAEPEGAQRGSSSDETPAIAWEERWAWWIVSAILAMGVVLRLHLIDMPLDRDEGEYAYGGQLLLQGILPYAGLYSMKLPGMYFINAIWLGLLGETPVAVHTGLLITHGATAVLIFVLGRRMGNARMGWWGIGHSSCVLPRSPGMGAISNAYGESGPGIARRSRMVGRTST